jgi:hypothetical protein
MKDYGKVEANRFLMEKQSMEVALALDILEVFNDTLLPNLRKMCIESVLMVAEELDGSVPFYNEFNKEWKKYDCFMGIHGWNTGEIIKRAKFWTASQCGDWIRVYGEIVENKFLGETEDNKRRLPMKGPQGSWKKAQPKADAGKQNLSQPNFEPNAKRRRVEFKQLWDDQKDIYTGMCTPSKELMNTMPNAGIKKWAIMADDITGKMDQAFGLMPGATISGTTTDNIFFLDFYGRLFNDPVYNLLPLGTIVGGGHHSLLEVALPLTVNGWINYSVGCYSTLFPDRAPMGNGNDGGAVAIKNFLIAYEGREESRLMLFYYNGVGRIDGCLVCGAAEKQRWVKEFKADDKLMNEFMLMHDWPSKGQVEVFAMKHNLYVG